MVLVPLKRTTALKTKKGRIPSGLLLFGTRSLISAVMLVAPVVVVFLVFVVFVAFVAFVFTPLVAVAPVVVGRVAIRIVARGDVVAGRVIAGRVITGRLVGVARIVVADRADRDADAAGLGVGRNERKRERGRHKGGQDELLHDGHSSVGPGRRPGDVFCFR